jgi:hypothetical protein
MAAFLKTISPSLATKLPCNSHRLTLTAGEDIAAGDPMYIKSDGLWWRSNGTAATAPAKVQGWATVAAKAGSPVTGYWNVHLAYGPSTATPGASLFVSATLGQLDTAATTGGTAAVATVDYISQDGSTPHAVLFVTRSTY